ncbi:hypothetical protein CCL17_24425 [Pseudomonas congelans]|nr:hypothetical protein CCL17_24425 [Pseudomonas congelans]
MLILHARGRMLVFQGCMSAWSIISKAGGQAVRSCRRASRALSLYSCARRGQCPGWEERFSGAHKKGHSFE